jgi:hypothetical protein
MEHFQAKKLHQAAFIQKCLILGDLLLTLLSEFQAHTFYFVAGCYFIQFLLIVANIIQLLILFANTFAFRAGMVQIMLAEFMGVLGVYALYFCVFVITRGFGAVTFSHSCLFL